MIRLHQVEKRFGRVRAVRGINLSIEPGQIVGILGPNGAGKTTTIRMITGLLPPSAGTVSVDGLDTIAHSRQVRRKLGYLPESAPLYPEMGVRSYLLYRAALYEMPRREAKSAVHRCIERCHLGEVALQRIGTLSKGFRQRVGMAAAMLHDPQVLILDEPTSGLDPAQVVEARSLIRELAGRRTMLLVSHILPEVEKTCDRIVVFARGSIRADGAPGELVARAASRSYVVEARAAGSAGVPAPLASLPGVTHVDAHRIDDQWVRCTLEFSAPSSSNAEPDPRESIFRACASAGLVLRELRARTASLEEFYIRLIERAGTEESSS